jgi:hypothetical protein
VPFYKWASWIESVLNLKVYSEYFNNATFKDKENFEPTKDKFTFDFSKIVRKFTATE